MQRAYGNNATSTVPTLPTSLQTGYPNTNGSTAPGYWWYYMITESLMNLLSATGITPSTTDMTQITQAVISLAKANSVTGTLKPVRLIDTLGAVVYNGTQTIDGVTPANGDRVLRNAPSTASPVANGIYIVNTAGAWARSSDMAIGALIPEATMVAVSEGTANSNTLWAMNPVSGETATINTTSITWNNITASTQALLSSYLKISDAAVLYQTIQGAQTTYQTIANMSGYLTTGTASATYLTISNASSTYQPLSGMSNYVTYTAGDSRYLQPSTAAAIYQPLSGMGAYLTTSVAGSTYQTQSAMSAYSNTTQVGTLITNALSNYYPKSVIDSSFAGYTPTTTLNANFVTYTYGGNTYQTLSGMSSYYSTAQSDGRYYQITAANNTFQTQSAMSAYSSTTQMNTAISNALSAYYTASVSDNRYYTQTAINQSFAQYTPTTTLNQNFVTYSYGGGTYQTLAGMTAYAPYSYVQGNPQMNSLGVGTAATGTAGQIVATGYITGSYSDDRLKNREEGGIPNALEIVEQLDVFFYTPNEYALSLGLDPRRDAGMSAQQHQKLFPTSVAKSGVQHSAERAGEEPLLTLHYERDVPLLVEAVKQLSAKFKAEQAENVKLREDVDRLIHALRRSPGDLGRRN